MSEQLFNGLRVIDCASFVAAPAAATIFADFGADVIKIEPLGGEAHRGTYKAGVDPAPEHNYLWMLSSRSKRSLAVDLKRDQGRAILMKLLETADVFITNFPLTVRRRLKIDYDDLAARFPSLIYGSFTAYGETGRERDKPGFDSTSYWARSGLMDQMRQDRDTPPLLPTLGLGDNPAGVMLYAAIVSALYRRERTGRGGLASSSLLAGGLWTNSMSLQARLCGHDLPERVNRASAPNACSNTYRCADGGWFSLVIANEEKFWIPLLQALGLEHLDQDARFATLAARLEHSRDLIAIFDTTFASADLAHWRARLDAAGIVFGTIATLDDAAADEQAIAIGALVPFSHRPDILTVNSPFDIRGIAKAAPGPAPDVGEHSSEILREIGYDAETIAGLRDCGAIAGMAAPVPDPPG